MATRRVFNTRHSKMAGTRPHSAAQLGVAYELYGDQSSTEPNTLLDTGPGSVGPGAIVDGSISPSKFDVTIRPPIYYDGALPPSDSSVASLYIEGALLFWGGTSGNKKLWRHNGTTFVISVDAADITVNQIVAGQIEVGAIGASHLQVGTMQGGRNLLKNGGFRDGVGGYSDYTTDNGEVVTGWYLAKNGDTTASVQRRDVGDTSWTLRDGDVDSPSSTRLGSTLALHSNANTSKSPYLKTAMTRGVVGGEVYSISALFGCHRVTGAAMNIWWYDNASAYISTSSVNATAAQLAKTGGSWRDGWAYMVNENITAPANATQFIVALIMTTPYTSGTDCYLFLDQVMFVKGAKAVPYEPQEAAGTRNSDGNVIIDSNGITINNGKLYLQDEWGTATLGASGFGGSWSDFIGNGLYNSQFAYGGVGTCGNGETSMLPYWTVARTGSPVLTHTDWGWLGMSTGRAVTGTFSATTDTLYIDSALVPVIGGRTYVVDALAEFGWGAGYVRLTAEVIYYTGGLVEIGAYQTFVLKDATAYTAPALYISPPAIAGLSAEYAMVRLTMKEYTTHSANNFVRIGSVALREQTTVLDDLTMTGRILSYDSNAMTSFTPGCTEDGINVYDEISGWYTKIGKMVFVNIYINCGEAGSGTTNRIILTTPTAPNRSNRQVIVGNVTGGVANPGAVQMVALTSGTGNNWELFTDDGGDMVGANWNASTIVTIQGWYLEA